MATVTLVSVVLPSMTFGWGGMCFVRVTTECEVESEVSWGLVGVVLITVQAGARREAARGGGAEGRGCTAKA